MAQRLGQTPCHGEIDPVGIGLLDEADLPGAMPALELFLSGDGAIHRLEELGMDEAVDMVARGEARNLARAMLPDASRKIGRDADIQCPAGLAGEDVGARALALHEKINAVPWMLKQVQHDGWRVAMVRPAS